MPTTTIEKYSTYIHPYPSQHICQMMDIKELHHHTCFDIFPHPVTKKTCHSTSYLIHLYSSLNSREWMCTTEIAWLNRWIREVRGGTAMAYEEKTPARLKSTLEGFRTQVEERQDKQGTIIIGTNGHFYCIMSHLDTSMAKGECGTSLQPNVHYPPHKPHRCEVQGHVP